MLRRLLPLLALLLAVSANAGSVIISQAPAAGGGGAPVLETPIGSGPRTASGATSITHNLSTALSAGDYHILITGIDTNVSTEVVCPGTSEYTRDVSNQGSSETLQLCRKVSSGGSDSNVVTWTTANGVHGASLSVSGVTGTVTVATASNQAGTTAPDCPAVSFTAPALLLCICSGDNEGDNLTTAIGGSWSQVTHLDGGSTATAPWIHVEQCTANSGTDCNSGDPPTFTLGSATNSSCRTVALED